MTKLHDKKPEATGIAFYVKELVDVIKTRDALCGLTLLLVVLTACTLLLHERGIDVIPRAAAAEAHP